VEGLGSGAKSAKKALYAQLYQLGLEQLAFVHRLASSA
jgi:hypothetical protein